MRAAGRRGADESAEDDRIHTYIDSPAHEREGDSTEKCDDAHLSGSGFKTARAITARADVLASLVRPPLWAVHEFGIVVIPACSELGRKAATALSRAPPTNKWNKIFNGRTNTGQQDRRRHAWPTRGRSPLGLRATCRTALRRCSAPPVCCSAIPQAPGLVG